MKSILVTDHAPEPIDRASYPGREYQIGSSSIKIAPKLTHKMWGIEESIGINPVYQCKIMTVEPEAQVSLHLHKKKIETFILLQGKLTVETIDTNTGEKFVIDLQNKFDNITIINNVPHTFYCPDGQEEETIFLEVSTEDRPEDNVRFSQSTDNRYLRRSNN